MNKQTQDQLVLATKIITPILLVSITGGIAFWYVRKQKEIKKLHDEQIAQMNSDKEKLQESIEKVEEALESKTEELQHAVFDDIDTSGAKGEIVENAEFAEMRKRYSQPPAPVEVFKPDAEIVSHNAFKEELVSDPEDNDGEVTEEDIKKHEESKVTPPEIMQKKFQTREDSIKLIHERNSNEAFEAFIQWYLVDIDFEDEIEADRTIAEYALDFGPGQPQDILYLLAHLFKIPAFSENEYDDNFVEIAMNKRIEYFGEDSVFAKGPISIAEVMIYWAERLSEDTNDSSVWAFLAQFINNLDLYSAEGVTPTQMQERIDSVMRHEYITPKGFRGMFGLDDSMWGQLQGVDPTFQIEYNIFLQDILSFQAANQ